MIIVDASLLVAAVFDDGGHGHAARRRLRDERLAAPELIDLEVLSVLRRAAQAGSVPERRAQQAVADLVDLPLQRIPHVLLAHRCWQLRHNATVSDAAYLASAELFGAPLVTADRKLAGTPGIACSIEVVN